MELLHATFATLYIDSTMTEASKFWELLLNLFSTLAIAVISIGVISIIINFRDWKSYFQERLAEIIVKKSYLQTLDSSELLDLQTATLKAFFKVEDIDREGSFLNHFFLKTHSLIGSHFREDWNLLVNLDYHKENGEITADEVVSWRCRKVGDNIQKKLDMKESRRSSKGKWLKCLKKIIREFS